MPRLAPNFSDGFIYFPKYRIVLGIKILFPIMGTNAASPKSFPDLLPRIDILKALGIQSIIALRPKT